MAVGAVQAEHGAAGVGGCRPAEVAGAGLAASSAGCGLVSGRLPEEGVEVPARAAFARPGWSAGAGVTQF